MENIKKLNVVIAEPIPSLNKGEAAILRGIQESISLCGDINLIQYSPPSWIDDDRERYGNNINVVTGIDLMDIANNFSEHPIPRSRIYFLKTWMTLIIFSLMARISKQIANSMIKDDFLKSLTKADLIIAGHDGMLGYNHFWIVLAARIMKKPIALFGGGNDYKGRSKKYKVRKFLQFIANNSILLTVRDVNTRDYFIANNVDPNKIHVFPDPAVLLKPCSEKRVNDILKVEGISNYPDKPLYGLIPVMGGIVFEKSFSYEKDLNKKHELRIKLWVDIVLHLLDTTDAHLVFIPHCLGPTIIFDDRRMLNDIYTSLPRGKDRITLISNEYSESELKGLMKRCDFVLGERTHALIGSVSVATPCIALTVDEDLRMYYIIKKMFKRKIFNLNNPDIESLKIMLTEEWNNRNKTADKMKIEAEHIHEEAFKSAKLLKERIETYLAKF